MDIDKENKTNAQRAVNYLNQIREKINQQSFEIVEVLRNQGLIILKQKELNEAKTQLVHLSNTLKDLFATNGEYNLKLEQTSFFSKERTEIKHTLDGIRSDIFYCKKNIDELTIKIIELDNDIGKLQLTASTKSITSTAESLHQTIATYNNQVNTLSTILGEKIPTLSCPYISGSEQVVAIFLHPLAIENGQLVVLDGEENSQDSQNTPQDDEDYLNPLE